LSPSSQPRTATHPANPHEAANVTTAAIGLLLSLVATGVLAGLAWRIDDSIYRFSLILYGITLVGVYAFSTIYHAVTDPVKKLRWRRLDHCSIYLLIIAFPPATAGSLTGHANSGTVRVHPMTTQSYQSPLQQPLAGGWIPFLAHFLFVLVGWTLVIKYIFPITFAAAEGEALTTYIFWDLWPVAHVWMGWALLRWQWYTPHLAITMSIIEIIIIVTLFTLFLTNPDEEWSIWRTNWFINKIFVLLCFTFILATFTLGRSHVARYRKSLPSVTH